MLAALQDNPSQEIVCVQPALLDPPDDLLRGLLNNENQAFMNKRPKLGPWPGGVVELP